ncbi:MAG: hypothetical protein K6B64_04800 [Acholeplasmatales bacterium]|nr:hypothetical protein [Acholeplasmatales bacterium]
MAHIDINLISNAMGRAVSFTLILPTKTAPTLEANYDAKTNTYYQNKKNKKYPLLILLHGLLNDQNNWCRYARAEYYAEENNIAICMVSGENKFFMNWDHQLATDHFFDFIEYELKDFLYGTFPISSKREDNFIAGLSMGGYGALYHGLMNNKAYSAIGAFSAPYKEMKENGFDFKKIIGRKTDLPFIYISCGEKDSLLEDNNELDLALTDLDFAHLYNIVPGYAHEWRFWDLELERFIKGLKRTDPYKIESPREV